MVLESRLDGMKRKLEDLREEEARVQNKISASMEALTGKENRLQECKKNLEATAKEKVELQKEKATHLELLQNASCQRQYLLFFSFFFHFLAIRPSALTGNRKTRLHGWMDGGFW